MELWHALNRGVDGRDLFMDDLDRLRFIHDMYEFNDATPADSNVGYRFQSKYRDIVSPYIKKGVAGKERLVDIHGWCLMRNHYHLLLSEVAENGMSLFLRKLNVGYAKSFNEKYKRVGTLFQSRTKKILVEHEAHFNYILHYIHLNPLDYLVGAEAWRERSHAGIRSAKDAIDFLEQYRWSSYLDYAGKKNFPSILTTSLFKGTLGDYPSSLREYLKDAEDDLNLLRLE
jgi:putative transposase